MRWMIVGWLALLAVPALAAPPVPDTLAQRIKACTSCHGEHGEGGANGYNPRIAGKPALYLYRQLLNFRDGRRHYPLMEHMVARLDDAYLREIAEYFAAQVPPHPAHAVVALTPAQRQRGEALVRHGDAARKLPPCQACHGERLTGVAPAVPALVGLMPDYISAQLGAWRSHTRGAPAPDCMATIAARLDKSDIAAIAGWLASQPLPADMTPAATPTEPPPLECGSIGP
ncbi:MAG TPA: c-type cytochrome [Rhodanobacteraceae bacterium]|nr:c-type cytochrome [Rhodanobacteraceae bacterium]